MSLRLIATKVKLEVFSKIILILGTVQATEYKRVVSGKVARRCVAQWNTGGCSSKAGGSLLIQLSVRPYIRCVRAWRQHWRRTASGEIRRFL